MPGVMKFITAKDIPGVNNSIGYFKCQQVEKIFCDKEVEYAGQGVGLIIAGKGRFGF
jgi:xanthine dehydrogenase molybdopterin-binding subunit B